MAKALLYQYTSSFGRHQQLVWQGGDIPAGLNIPRPDDNLVRDYRRQIWKLSHAPRVGRFYPGRFLPGNHTQEIFRVHSSNEQRFRGDLNPASAYVSGKLSSIEDASLPAGMGTVDTVAQWAGMECPLREQATDFNEPAAFARENESPDSLFYEEYRPVLHVDSRCAQRIENCYRQLIPSGKTVLDLMASRYSHLPLGYTLTGLGMNQRELEENSLLAQYVVQDLNQQPQLPFSDASFDAVINTVSIEYLTDPEAILAEVMRVLRPGGRLIISFSNRYFPTKAISLWIDLHPMERLAWVLQCLQKAGFEDLASHVERGLPRPEDDRYAQEIREADPLFAVWGRRPAEE